MTEAILPDLSAKLATALAMGVYTPEQLCNQFAISRNELEKRCGDPHFQQMVYVVRNEWAAVENSKERIRLKAQLAAEESISTLATLIGDSNQPASARIQAVRELRDLADLAPKKTTEDDGKYDANKIQISINFRSAPRETIQGKSEGVVVEGIAEEV